MKTLSLLLTLVILLAFSSCQREVDGGLPGIVQADTALLKTTIYLDTTKASGLDTVAKMIYTFDSQKRLVTSYQSEYSYSGPTVTKNEFHYTALYNGLRLKPYKVVFDGNYVSYLYYDSQDSLVRDSSLTEIASPVEAYIRTYARNPNGIGYVSVEKERDLATGTITVRDSTLYRRSYANGNLVGGTDSIYHPASLSTYKYQYTFDAKPNAFLSLASAFNYLGNYYFSGDSYLLPISANNAVNFSEIYSSSLGPASNTTGTVSYQYRSDGMPVTGKIAGHPRLNKVLFQYY